MLVLGPFPGSIQALTAIRCAFSNSYLKFVQRPGRTSATTLARTSELGGEPNGWPQVYLLAHVEDDIGEATVSGALEAAGITGRQAGQVRLHRVLFCGTLEGKVSLVRQLEPDMHVDGESRTVRHAHRCSTAAPDLRAGCAMPASPCSWPQL